MVHLLNFRETMETIVESLFVASMMRKTDFMWSTIIRSFVEQELRRRKQSR